MKINPFAVPTPITDRWYRNVYLQSNFWRWRREAYMKQQGFYCEATWNGLRCRSPGTQVHHRTYANLFCERDEDLMLLCDECHCRTHKWSKAANDNGQLSLMFDWLEQK